MFWRYANVINRELKQKRPRRLGKRLLKSASNFITLIISHLIRQILAIFSGVEF